MLISVVKKQSISSYHSLILSLGVVVIVGLIGSLLAALIYYSLPALMSRGLSIYVVNDWNPNTGNYGAFAAVYGTVIVASISIIIVMPLALGSAIFINEFAPEWLRRYLVAINDVMAGFPTVIYGFWGLYVLGPVLNSTIFAWLNHYLGFIPLFSTKPVGGSYLLASIVISIMVMPFASSLIREVYAQVPRGLIEGIYALGLTKWDAIRIKLSYIAKSIIGALTLALGRGMGETVAVALTVGGVLRVSPSLLSPGITIPSFIANQFGSAFTQMEQSAMFSLALLLLAIGLFFIIASKLVLLRGDTR
ncbi:MAG: phosphate ABC transporter permease subunit PstC [Vulcanisaeta sp.]|jgi:phosphate transport system permease protein|uniref:phosphate ABC transporter permease subunit PstC n=1 Tax=Vulcanisaeta sp. TaxID=2020871 RepID=UPI003D1287A3